MEALHETGTCRNAHYRDEHVQTDIVQHPLRRFGNAPEGGVLTAEPAEEQAGNQCAAACAQADGDAADMDGKCSEQTSDKDTQAYEYHVRLVGRAVYIPQTFGCCFHFLPGTYHFDDVAGIYYRLCQHGNGYSGALDAPDTDCNRLAGNRLACDCNR